MLVNVIGGLLLIPLIGANNNLLLDLPFDLISDSRYFRYFDRNYRAVDGNYNEKQTKRDDETSERFYYNSYSGYNGNNPGSAYFNLQPQWPNLMAAPYQPPWHQTNYFGKSADAAKNDLTMQSSKCGIRNPYPDDDVIVDHDRAKRGAIGTEEKEDELQLRIVGGQMAEIGDWPWQVSIHHDGIHACGGAILTGHYILTAAHCFSNHHHQNRSIIDGIDDWTVYAAKSNLELVDEPGELGPMEIEDITIHPNYNKLKQFDSDLALIRLKLALKFSNKMFPICLPKQGSFTPVGSDCFVTGFGQTKGTGGYGRLKVARTPVIASSDCGVASHRQHLTSNMLCAGFLQGGIGTCQGDSGGPLSCLATPNSGLFILQGIVSFGYECAGRYQPSVYVRIANYVDWVKQVIATYRPKETRQEISSVVQTTTIADENFLDVLYRNKGNQKFKNVAVPTLP